MRTSHTIDVHHVNKAGDEVELELTVTKDDDADHVELQIGRGSTVLLTSRAIEQLKNVL